MHSGRESLRRASLAVFLAVSVFVVHIHWHSNAQGQSCSTCHVRHMPTLHTSSDDTFNVARVESRLDVSDVFADANPAVKIVSRGRAPPNAGPSRSADSAVNLDSTLFARRFLAYEDS
jgi:hypothetical protein